MFFPPIGETEDDRVIFNPETQLWERGSGNSGTARRITVVDSPYALLLTDKNLFCDTDDGPITVDLPAGVDGLEYRVVNTGSSAKDVTLVPNGLEDLVGENSSVTLFDGDVLDVVYERTEGWW